jgi:nitric oxide reductase NorE protein
MPQIKNHVPGEVGIWVLILGDMLVFGLFFLVFVYYRGFDVELYNRSQASLNQNFGAINTLLLLASSWFVVMAVEKARVAEGKPAAMLFGVALLCGGGFSVVKIIEYREKLAAGFTITSNDFFMYYYIFTGLHFLHVLIGMGVLTFLIIKTRSVKFSSDDMVLVESGASFWHLVDLLWIVLFPLLYLMK